MDTTSSGPPRPISRLRLTLLLVIISLVPPIFVVSMVATHKPPPDPVLEVVVREEVQLHSPRISPDRPRLLPSLVVENPTDEPWRHVTIYVNKDFVFVRQEPLEPHSTFSVPLEFFVTKGGNVAFQPGSERVEQVLIFAQIPSGARAVREIHW